MTNWRILITREMDIHADGWENVVQCTLSDKELDKKFDNDFGAAEGEPFTLWTLSRVYFPVTYDGAEWCASVSRDPDGLPTGHVGGG